jgi:hypothetical protein
MKTISIKDISIKDISIKDIDIKQKVWNIIGKAGSGKSFLSSKIIQELNIPSSNIISVDDFEKEKESLTNLSNFQLNKINYNYSELRPPTEYIIILGNNSKFEYNNIFRFLIFNARYIHFTIIIESQSPINFPSSISCNIDYYVVTKGFVSKELQCCIEKTLSVPDFAIYYNKLNKFDYLLINNTYSKSPERFSILNLNKENVSTGSVKNLIKHFESNS